MPPKRIAVDRRAPRGVIGSTYDALTSSENAAVVRSIALFGAAVTFLSSSWGEILLPPRENGTFPDETSEQAKMFLPLVTSLYFEAAVNMTTTLSSLRTSPRKILSDSSETRSLTGSSSFAQLLSRFEVLNAASSAADSPRASPTTKTEPVSAVKLPSISAQTPSKIPRQSQGPTKTRERSSAESSHVSPGRFVTSSRDSPRPRRARTFGVKSPVTPRSHDQLSPRHKSVAERRRMFETTSQEAGETSTPHTSAIPRPNARLAHSKSWQSIKNRRSAPEPHTSSTVASHNPKSVDRNSILNVFSSPRTVPSPRTLVASDDSSGTWRSPLHRPNDSWSSFKHKSYVVTAPDASPSYIKSQYIGTSPHAVQKLPASQANPDDAPDDEFVERSNVLIQDTRRYGWVKNARKIASSLTNTVSVGSSRLRKKSHGSQDTCSQDPSSYVPAMFFKITKDNVPSHTKLPRSRISSLRKKFDYPKGQSTASLPPLKTKHCESVLANAETSSSPSKIPLLKSYTSSDSGDLITPKYGPKSHINRQDQQFKDRPQTPINGRNTEKHVSPLKQRIDLFESLDHRDSTSDASHSFVAKKQPFSNSFNEKSSAVGPVTRFKGNLPRVSASCRRIPSEWSTTSSQDIGVSLCKSPCNSPVTDQVMAEVTEGSPSPQAIDTILEQSAIAQKFLTNEIPPLVLSKPSSLPRVSINPTGFNIDGESGIYPAPAPLFSKPHTTFSRTKHALSRTANRFSLPNTESELELIELLGANRQEQLRSTLFISKAQCELEQPRPVRANELRRIVNLCKHKVRKLSAGRSE
ncbi:hypothetical protein F66182_405 [Fusarium sp. NRRL 66182]|nr:hypothetical protein F66182_405 [Fusarium sp. NRRL 66182]